MTNSQVIDKTIEIFGFLMGQSIASSPLTPKDTTRMAKSFPATMQVMEGSKGKFIRYTTPHYTKFVNDGTKRIKARKFIQQIFHQKGQENLKKAFQMASKEVNNK